MILDLSQAKPRLIHDEPIIPLEDTIASYLSICLDYDCLPTILQRANASAVATICTELGVDTLILPFSIRPTAFLDQLTQEGITYYEK